MRARYRCTSSRELRRPSAIARCISGIVASTTSKLRCGELAHAARKRQGRNAHCCRIRGHMDQKSPKAVYAAIGANLAIAVTKFIAAGLTGSSAMIAEGVHSLVDTGNGALLLLGLRLSPTPA